MIERIALLRTLAISLLTMSLLAGCGGKEERKAKYLERGKAYLAEGNYDKARVELKNVLQIDPKDAQGYLYLGEVEEKLQAWPKAFGAYKKASELAPDLIEPRVRLGKLYMMQASALQVSGNGEAMANVLGLVQDEIKEIRARDPENLEARTLEAILWLKDGETDKAIEQLEVVVGSDPGLQSAVIALAGLYGNQGQPQQAEVLFLAALEQKPDDLRLKQKLAAHYIRFKENSKAEAVLRQLVAAEPNELVRRVTLASFLSRTEQANKAEKVLKEAIAADPEDSQRYLLLAEFLSSTQSPDDGIAALEKYSQQNPDMSELNLALAKAYYKNGQKEEVITVLRRLISDRGVEPIALEARIMLAQTLASKDASDPQVVVLVDEVLEENPRDNGALLLKGKIAAGKQDFVEAIGYFRSVLKDQPNNAEVAVSLAASHLGNDEHALALNTLQRSVENNPENKELRLSLAKLLAESGEHDQAIEQLDAILKLDENHMPALVAKYEWLALKGDADGMLTVVRQMEGAAPDDESIPLREAKIYFAQTKYGEALRVLDGVLSREPGNLAALLAKSETLAVQERYSDAMPIVQEIIRIQPDSAEGYYRKAKLLAAMGKDEDAIEQLEIAIEKAPTSEQVLTSYAELQIKFGNQDAAKRRVQRLIEANPNHKSAYAILGFIAMSEKAYAEAEAALENQIKIHPDIVAGYTSLARARLASDDISGAANAFKRGLEISPGNVALLIGLAGIQERQGNFEAAIATYEKVLVVQPENAVSTNNLAALMSDHRTDEQSLARALALSAKLEKTQQPAFLDTAAWIYYRAGQYEKAEKILKGVVESAPKVPVFQYHLGMVYSKLGNKEAARKHLTLATDGDFSYQGLDEAKATLAGL